MKLQKLITESVINETINNTKSELESIKHQLIEKLLETSRELKGKKLIK